MKIKDSHPHPKPVVIPRYDPSAPNASTFEVNEGLEDSVDATSRIKRKKRKKHDSISSNDNQVKRTTSEKEKDLKSIINGHAERLHSVASNLKDIFAENHVEGHEDEKNGGFKLSALLGSTDQTNEVPSSLPSIEFQSFVHQKKTKKKKKEIQKEARKSLVEESGSKSESKSPSERFFFETNDTRLLEDPFFKPELIPKLKASLFNESTSRSMRQSFSKKKKYAKSAPYLQNKEKNVKQKDYNSLPINIESGMNRKAKRERSYNNATHFQQSRKNFQDRRPDAVSADKFMSKK